MRDHAAFALLESRDAPAAVVAFARKRIAQHAVDALPGGEHLRAGVLGVSRPDASRILRVVISTPRPVGSMPIRRSALDQVGLRDDAGAAAGELALHPLEDVDLPAGAPQQQRRQEPAHRAADDEGPPRSCAMGSIRHFLPHKSLLYIGPNLGGMPWP